MAAMRPALSARYLPLAVLAIALCSCGGGGGGGGVASAIPLQPAAPAATPTPTPAPSAAPASAATLAIANAASGELSFYAEGSTSPYLTISASTLGLQPGQFQPAVLALDGQNDLFVGDESSGTVMEFAPPYTSPPIVQIGSGINSPLDLAVSPQGTVFVAITDLFYIYNTSQAVRMYAPPYSTEQDLPIPSGDTFAPFCLALDAQGDLFATNAAATTPGTLEYPSPYTATPAAFAFGGNYGYLSGGGCALDQSNGELFVAGGSSTSAYAPPYTGQPTTIGQTVDADASIAVSSVNHDLFLANGNEVDVYPPPYTTKVPITSGVNGAIALAVDAQGNLFVSNGGNNTITEYAAPYTGGPLTTITLTTSAPVWMIVIP